MSTNESQLTRSVRSAAECPAPSGLQNVPVTLVTLIYSITTTTARLHCQARIDIPDDLFPLVVHFGAQFYWKRCHLAIMALVCWIVCQMCYGCGSTPTCCPYCKSWRAPRTSH
jgi:hypothetical protein